MFALPPAFDGSVFTQTFDLEAARVQLLDEDCAVLATAPLPAGGSVLLVIADDTITATEVESRKTTTVSEPVDTDGLCELVEAP